MLFLGLMEAVVAFAACGLVVFTFVSEHLAGRAMAVRITAAVCALLWLAFLTFQILGLLGAFRLPVVVLLCLVLPVLVLARFRERAAVALRVAGEDLKNELEAIGTGMKKEPLVAAGVGGVALQLTAKLPPGRHCLAGRNFGVPQRAALSYHAGVHIQPPDAERRCHFLLVQGSPKHERDAPGRGWIRDLAWG